MMYAGLRGRSPNVWKNGLALLFAFWLPDDNTAPEGVRSRIPQFDRGERHHNSARTSDDADDGGVF